METTIIHNTGSCGVYQLISVILSRSMRRYYLEQLSCSRHSAGCVVPWPADLPTELVFEVFKYLSQSDLARACRVNQFCITASRECSLSGYAVASDPSLWRHLDLSQIPRECCVDGPPPTLVTRLNSLTSLTLVGPFEVPDIIFKGVINFVSQSPLLTSLTLRSAYGTNEDMLIDMFKNTRRSLLNVDLSFCHHLGSKVILVLVAHHPFLRTLNLSHTSVTDTALLNIQHLEH